MSRQFEGTGATVIGNTTNTSVHLIKLSYWDLGFEVQEDLFLTTSSQPIITSDDAGLPDATWQAIGLPGGVSGLGIGIASETQDARAQSIDLTLDGVDQTIISIINQHNFRGWPIEIWKAWVDNSTGQIVGSTHLWKGIQAENYEVTESRGDDSSATVTTRCVSHLTFLQASNEILTNRVSLNRMLARAGLATGDTGFNMVNTIQGKEIYWGTARPGVVNMYGPYTQRGGRRQARAR